MKIKILSRWVFEKRIDPVSGEENTYWTTEIEKFIEEARNTENSWSVDYKIPEIFEKIESKFFVCFVDANLSEKDLETIKADPKYFILYDDEKPDTSRMSGSNFQELRTYLLNSGFTPQEVGQAIGTYASGRSRREVINPLKNFVENNQRQRSISSGRENVSK